VGQEFIFIPYQQNYLLHYLLITYHPKLYLSPQCNNSSNYQTVKAHSQHAKHDGRNQWNLSWAWLAFELILVIMFG